MSAAREQSTLERQAPILLFGMPRSGTTWLGKILDSHPGTLYRHEPDSFGRLNFMPVAPNPEEAESWRRPLERFVQDLPAMTDTKVIATLPQFRKAYHGTATHLWNAAAIRAAKVQARLMGEARALVRSPPASDARVVWKSIESVGRLGTIVSALPSATGVLILRHPCGYVASVTRGKQQGRFTDGDSIGEDLGLLDAFCETDVAREYGIDPAGLRAMQPIQRLAWQWVLSNDKALSEIESRSNIQVCVYEDLCADPVTETTRLFSSLGLAMGEQTRRFIGASTSSHRERYYSVFKDPGRSARAWREELSTSVQRAVTRVAADTRAGAYFDL